MTSSFCPIPKGPHEEVLTKLWEAGPKLKLKKSKFLKVEIVYLGHIVFKGRVWTDKCKIKAIKNWSVPHTITEVRSFLRFANSYCWFLKRYTLIVHSLYELILGDNASKKNKPVKWTNHCQVAFDKIKNLC